MFTTNAAELNELSSEIKYYSSGQKKLTFCFHLYYVICWKVVIQATYYTGKIV